MRQIVKRTVVGTRWGGGVCSSTSTILYFVGRSRWMYYYSGSGDRYLGIVIVVIHNGSREVVMMVVTVVGLEVVVVVVVVAVVSVWLVVPDR